MTPGLELAGHLETNSVDTWLGWSCNDTNAENSVLGGVWEITGMAANGAERSFTDLVMRVSKGDGACDLRVEMVTIYADIRNTHLQFYLRLAGVTYLGDYNGQGTDGAGTDNPAYFEKTWETESVVFKEDSQSTSVMLAGLQGVFSGTDSNMVLAFEEGGETLTITLKKVDSSLIEAAATDPEDRFDLSIDKSCAE